MRRIFKSEDVIKIAEAVKIPDCVVRVQPQTLPESTLLEDFSEEENIISDDASDSAESDSYDLQSAENDIVTEENAASEEVPASELYEAEREKLLIERDAIIKQAQTEAAEIIEQARAESNTIIENANDQAKVILAAAMEDGYREGVQAKQEEIESCMLKINQLLGEMKSDQEEYFEKYSDELKFMALDIAEKLVAQKLDDDERVLIPLVRSAVKTLRDVSWIKVEVSDRLRDAAYDLELVLSEAKSAQNIEVELRRDADIGTCVVHTADGVIVASVLTQVENIREYFAQYKDSDEIDRDA